MRRNRVRCARRASRSATNGPPTLVDPGGPVPHEPARDWWSRWVVAAVAASAALVTVASAILRRGPPEVAAGAKRAEFKLQPGLSRGPLAEEELDHPLNVKLPTYG